LKWQVSGRLRIAKEGEMVSYYEPLRSFEIQAPGRVIFGLGAVNQLGQEIKKLGRRRCLIITDKNIAQTEILATVKDAIEKSGIRFAVYDDTETEPSIASLERLISEIKKTITTLSSAWEAEVP
jgi:alcohol dehydrogenase class IV